MSPKTLNLLLFGLRSSYAAILNATWTGAMLYAGYTLGPSSVPALIIVSAIAALISRIFILSDLIEDPRETDNDDQS